MENFLGRLVTSSIVLLTAAVIIQAQSGTNGTAQNEVEVRGTFSIPSGDASFGATTNSGSDISFSRDLDFELRVAAHQSRTQLSQRIGWPI